MGRELKRVPLNFNWPIRQTWKGYLCPYHSQPCSNCNSTGYNEETKKINDEWYNSDGSAEWINLPNGRRYNNNQWSNHITDVEVKALLKAGRLMDFTHVPRTKKQRMDVKKKIASGGNSWLPYNNGYIPTADEVNKWNRESIGHDGINMWICVEARAKHLGVYGFCDICNGEGEIWQNDKIKKFSDKWTRIEPRKGKGYQLWETTSEGSPNSPVFKTFDELCEWCEDNATTFGSHKTTKENWKKMLDDGYVYHKAGNAIFS